MKAALQTDDAAAIKKASETLHETWQAISAELYRAASEKVRPRPGSSRGQPGPEPGTGGDPEAGRNHDNPIIDAEVVEEKTAA